MRVNPNPEVPPRANVSATKPTSAQSDSADLSRTERLKRAFENTPEVRAAKVAHARALIQNESYPDNATLERIAGTLAHHLKPGSPAK